MSHTNTLQHLISMKSLDRDMIEAILNKAEYFLHDAIPNNKVTDSLKDRIVANLFFEPSTRTRNSFIIAAKRLNATVVLNPHLPHSAVVKGESLLDTIWTFEAMGVSDFIIRHAENGLPEWVSQELKTSAAVINAGDGTNQHPTQALIDLLTIRQHKKSWESLTVTIIGDIIHSRVAHSLIDGLTLMGVAQIHLVAPPKLLPDHELPENILTFNSLEDGIKDSDVIVTLRIQKERHEKLDDSEFNSFREHFCLTKQKLTLAKSNAIILHPGPMNRDVEIASEVADSSQSVILKQVHNGIGIRMAVFDLLRT
ncbi:aspartate carbamoyltransferase catalytic subunit [Candidiatus Paracoxiella cheracis]|uniref:aspartate carbamoyltransferase catalytic subunit n=1 Tax=Candidiatus Paracoxiella cheracis TaxID=3405120 RepID=UPI003BF4B5D1